jgi:polyisoprenyl-phosphate glycosyltransferase
MDHPHGSSAPANASAPSPTRGVPVTFVIPCHNESAVVEETARQLLDLLDTQVAAGRCSESSQVLFVDDGSTDSTWERIEHLAQAHPGRIIGLRLAGNVGHQHALLAGLTLAPGEVLISLDADLQDDISVVPRMLDLYRQGHDIVYGIRSGRGTDKAFKRLTAAGFYRLMRRMGVDIIYDHADYRLMSRRAVGMLEQFGEVNLFLRGVVRLIGLPSAQVTYQRRERFAGESKYGLLQMCALAIQGITSFSIAPLRVISGLGLLTSLFAMGIGVWVLVVRLVWERAIPGWASILLPVAILGGMQLLAIGVLGEYVGKIYLETKRRPRFLVDRTVGAPASERSEVSISPWSRVPGRPGAP